MMDGELTQVIPEKQILAEDSRRTEAEEKRHLHAGNKTQLATEQQCHGTSFAAGLVEILD